MIFPFCILTQLYPFHLIVFCRLLAFSCLWSSLFFILFFEVVCYRWKIIKAIIISNLILNIFVFSCCLDYHTIQNWIIIVIFWNGKEKAKINSDRVFSNTYKEINELELLWVDVVMRVSLKVKKLILLFRSTSNWISNNKMLAQ